MDFMMDIDDDLDSDPIRDFLTNKLEEIKLENVKLGKTLQELEAETKEVIDQIGDISKDIFINQCWLKLANNKYAIWYLVENRTTGLLKECQLTLYWNSPCPLSYKSSMFYIPDLKSDFNKSFKFIEAIQKKAYIVAMIDCPDFLAQLSLEISGLFSCHISNGSKVHVDIPDCVIQSKDSTNREIIVPVYKLIECNIPDFVSWLVCINKMILILQLTDSVRDIESILEIDASLYRINFTSKDVGRFFLAHKISPAFDGSILELSKSESSNYNKIVMYHRDQQSLLAFIHHLYRHVPSLILLPEDYEVRLHNKSTEVCEELLKKCIMNEIEAAKMFEKQQSTTKEDLKKFKLKLCDLEHETDKAYIQLRIANDQCESEEICQEEEIFE